MAGVVDSLSSSSFALDIAGQTSLPDLMEVHLTSILNLQDCRNDISRIMGMTLSLHHHELTAGIATAHCRLHDCCTGLETDCVILGCVCN